MTGMPAVSVGDDLSQPRHAEAAPSAAIGVARRACRAVTGILERHDAQRAIRMATEGMRAEMQHRAIVARRERAPVEDGAADDGVRRGSAAHCARRSRALPCACGPAAADRRHTADNLRPRSHSIDVSKWTF